MTERHRKYLKSRSFDPDQLEQDWGLLGTGPLGPFSNRIIIPIYQAGELVCYQGRDITGKSPTRYKSCSDDKAVLPIKSCLYGIDKVEGEKIIITEGATKVWRIGPPAVATFGAIVTDAQILMLKKFQRRIVLFDGDNTGRERAANLSARLGMFPGKTEVFELPDGISPDDVACAVNGVRKMCLED
jgi:DNA primase